MKLLSAGLWKKLSAQDKRKLSLWWSTLTPREQRELRRPPPRQSRALRLVGRLIDGSEASLSAAYDARPAADLLAAQPHKIPAHLSLYEANQADDALSLWSLLSFVNNHEDIGFFLQMRSFHVCRAHQAARRALCGGLIPADFACLLRLRACPITSLLSRKPGHALKVLVV